MIRKRENIVARNIHGKFFLINITENYLDNKCILYELNETGTFIWNKIDGDKDIDDISWMLKNAINQDIDTQILRQDIQEYLNILKSEGFIEYGRD